MRNLQPPPPLSQQPPLKIEILSSPIFENLVEVQPPPSFSQAEKTVAHCGLSILVPEECFCVVDTLRPQVH